MSIYKTNWSKYLASDSDIPPDVSFKVIEESLVDDEVKEISSTVSAHRFLLSEVFRRQFNGPLREDKDTIEIKQTTIEAFNAMIKFIYTNPDDFSVDSVTDTNTLFQLLNLAERYEMPELSMRVERAITHLKLTVDNVMIAANTAQQFAQFDQFEKVAEDLVQRCAWFLDATLRTKEDIYSFLATGEEKFPDVDPTLFHRLLKMNAESARIRSRIFAVPVEEKNNTIDFSGLKKCRRGHPLQKNTVNSANWICAKCDMSWGSRRRSSGFFGGMGDHNRYRCSLCDYDLCENCVILDRFNM